MLKTVLISAAGTGTAFGIASRLRSTWGIGVRIVTIDINPVHLVSSTLLADCSFQVPPAMSHEYGSAIIDIIRRERVDCWVPLLNSELRTAHDLRGEAAGVDIWSSELVAELCCDKRRSSDWLQAIGVPVPRTFEAESWEAGHSYFVKPIDGFGSRNAGVMNGEDLASLPEEHRAGLLVQEICQGPEVTVDSFYDSARGIGRAVARERIETKSGVCTKARVFRDEILSDYAARIARASAQRGAICFQVMRVDDRWVVTDLNFRPGAGTAISCAAGVDVISASFACRWEEPYERFLQPALPEQGIFVTRQYAEFVMPDP